MAEKSANTEKLSLSTPREEWIDHLTAHIRHELPREINVTVKQKPDADGRDRIVIQIASKVGESIVVFQNPIKEASNSVATKAAHQQRMLDRAFAAIKAWEKEDESTRGAKPDSPNCDEIAPEAIKGLRPTRINRDGVRVTIFKNAGSRKKTRGVVDPQQIAAEIEAGADYEVEWVKWDDQAFDHQCDFEANLAFRYSQATDGVFAYMKKHMVDNDFDDLRRDFEGALQRQSFDGSKRDGILLFEHMINHKKREGYSDIDQAAQDWDGLVAKVDMNWTPREIYTELMKPFTFLNKNGQPISNLSLVRKFDAMMLQSGFYPKFEADLMQRISSKSVDVITADMLREFADSWHLIIKKKKLMPVRHDSMLMYDGKGRIAAMVPKNCFLCGDPAHHVKDCPENPRNRDCNLDQIQAQLSKHGKGTIAAATEKPPKRKSAVDKLIAKSKCEPKKCFSTTPHSECDAACALCILRCGKSFEESKLCKGVKGADNHTWGCKLHFWHQAAEKQKVTKAQLLEVFPKSGERIATKHGCAGLTGSPMTADTAFEDYLSNEGFYADAEISGAYE